MNIFKYLFNKKYRFFADKISGVQKSLWELDFKTTKSRQVREGIRQDRDRELENVQRLEAMLKGDVEEEKRKALEIDLQAHVDNAKRFEAQMKMIDEQIFGVPASGDNPGQQGIQDTVQGLAELREMYRDYVKRI